MDLSTAAGSSSLSQPLAILATDQASSSSTGPSPGFLSLLEQMENEKQMWEERPLGLIAGSASRPGTAGNAAAAASRPGTASAPPAGATETQGADTLPCTDDVEEVVVADVAPLTSEAHDVLEDEPDGESRIAAALRDMGVEPSVEAVAEFVRSGETPAGQSRPASSWASSSRLWAAQRMRRKKERRGPRSGAGTPVAAAAGNTPRGGASPEPPRPSTAEPQEP